MKIFTSSWHDYKGTGRIGICRGNPRGQPAGYRLYKALAPTWEIMNNTRNQAEYRERFFAEVLGPLDPQQVLEHIAKLANGATPFLLCFEKFPLHDNNWCHRTMVAEWLNDRTNADVTEWQVESASDQNQAKLAV